MERSKSKQLSKSKLEKIEQYYGLYKTFEVLFGIRTSGHILGEFEAIYESIEQNVELGNFTEVFNKRKFDLINYKILNAGQIVGPALSKYPIIAEIHDQVSDETITFLTLCVGEPNGTKKYQQATELLFEEIINYLPCEKLVIVGHSAGAALVLMLVNHLTMTGKINDIKKIFILTSGLGLCDSIVVNLFEENIKNKSIEHYDFINLAGNDGIITSLNGGEEYMRAACNYGYDIDSWLLHVTITSPLNPLQSLHTKLMDLDIDEVLNSENLEELIVKEIDKLSKNTALLPINYLDYSKGVIKTLMQNIAKCKNRVDYYNCSDIFFSLHKHISNSYSLSKDNTRFNLRKVNKNKLFKQLLETDSSIYFRKGSNATYKLIQNDKNLCFSNMGNKFGLPEKAGSHKLSNYHYNLKKSIETYSEPRVNPISDKIKHYVMDEYIDLYLWKEEPLGIKFGSQWPKIKKLQKGTLGDMDPNINIGMELVSINDTPMEDKTFNEGIAILKGFYSENIWPIVLKFKSLQPFTGKLKQRKNTRKKKKNKKSKSRSKKST